MRVLSNEKRKIFFFCHFCVFINLRHELDENYIVHYQPVTRQTDFHKKNPLDLIHSFLLIIRSYYEKQAKEKLKELRQVAKNKTFSGEYESDLDYDEEVNYFLVFCCST